MATHEQPPASQPNLPTQEVPDALAWKAFLITGLGILAFTAVVVIFVL